MAKSKNTPKKSAAKPKTAKKNTAEKRVVKKATPAKKSVKKPLVKAKSSAKPAKKTSAVKKAATPVSKSKSTVKKAVKPVKTSLAKNTVAKKTSAKTAPKKPVSQKKAAPKKAAKPKTVAQKPVNPAKKTAPKTASKKPATDKVKSANSPVKDKVKTTAKTAVKEAVKKPNTINNISTSTVAPTDKKVMETKKQADLKNTKEPKTTTAIHPKKPTPKAKEKTPKNEKTKVVKGQGTTTERTDMDDVKVVNEVILPTLRDTILAEDKKNNSESIQPDKVAKTRYSDAELQEFKELIINKMNKAKDELKYLQDQISRKSDIGSDDSDLGFKGLEDGTNTAEREYLSQMASRQLNFISHLDKALMRIENKTYGICRETGRLISKERLKAVPHATLSIEAKTAKGQ